MVWNRQKEGIVHALDIQRSQWNDKEATSFTINMGVCVRDAQFLATGKVIPSVVTGKYCYPHLRVGDVLGRGGLRHDVWWTLKTDDDVPLVGNEVRCVLQDKCIPFLDTLDSIGAVAALAEDPVFRRFPAERLSYATLRYVAGEHEEARSILIAMMADAKLTFWHGRVCEVTQRLGAWQG
ncbi:MAG: DUF4304 domain-containing protein [Phycisphaerae bacterium]|nr:DUF4304 domain-containing protein [Phycisphaerae bacterium]